MLKVQHPPDDVGTDEARASCDEDLHRAALSLDSIPFFLREKPVVAYEPSVRDGGHLVRSLDVGEPNLRKVPCKEEFHA